MGIVPRLSRWTLGIDMAGMTEREEQRASPDDYGQSDGRWLEIDWRSEIRSIEVDSDLGRTEVEYIDRGSGSPLLLVHGLAGSWRNWLENVPALADHHRVVALDLPGFGNSPLPKEPLSMPGLGDLLVRLADDLGLGPDTTIVGHSMGGLVATEAVLELPDRFASIGLAAAAGISVAHVPKSRKELTKLLMTLDIPVGSRYATRGLKRPRVRAAQLSTFIAHPNRIGPEILWELVSWGTRSPGTLQAAFAMAGYDTRHRLPEIDLPTLLIWGARDRLVPLGAAYAYRKRIDHADVSILDDTGHMLQIERPPTFNYEILEFIRRHDPSGPASGQMLLETPLGDDPQVEP